MIKKLFSHSLIYGLAPQIGSIAGIVALPIITRDLTETDFGIWGVLLAYIGAFKALSNLGLGVVISNSFFKIPLKHKWVWRQIYGFLHLWMIPFNLTIAGILWLIMPEEALGNRTWIIAGLLLPDLIFGPTVILATFYYQLGQKPLPIAIRTAIFGILTVLLNVWFISGLKLGYMGWLWTSLIVNTLMAISYWYPINIKHNYTPIFNFKWRSIKKAIRIGIPTVPHQYASFLMNSSDRIVLDGLHVSMANLGEYNLASRFGSYFQTMVGSANKAISPIMFECYKEQNDREARDLIFVLQTAVLAATFFFCLWSREVFQVLIKNTALAQVYPLAIIIVMAHNYRPMYIGAMNKLFYTEKTGLLWRVSFVAGVGNIVLNLIFVPLFGFEAAAYTTFACLMYMGFAGHFIKQIKAVQTEKYYPMFWFFMILLNATAAYSLKDADLVLKIVISLVVLLGLAGGAHKFRKWQVQQAVPGTN